MIYIKMHLTHRVWWCYKNAECRKCLVFQFVSGKTSRSQMTISEFLFYISAHFPLRLNFAYSNYSLGLRNSLCKDCYKLIANFWLIRSFLQSMPILPWGGIIWFAKLINLLCFLFFSILQFKLIFKDLYDLSLV